jgi:8-amino-7-oxononanoate synthase
MLDFTSSLYLGLTHPHHRLPPWRQLTTGVPSVLGEPAAAGRVAHLAALLIGVEQVVLSRSTLHALFDVVGALCEQREPAQFLVDSGAYPVTRWALHRASMRGAPVIDFAHHDVQDLNRSLKRAPRGPRPIIVADGACPACGPSPLGDYFRVAQERDGIILVDDTQALGILGAGPSPDDPYGRGGGGTPAWLGVPMSRTVIVASLAKGFGAPVAITGGPASLVGRLVEGGDTRLHCSPPTIADLLAAEQAVKVNQERGDELRRRLAALVARLRMEFDALGVPTVAGNAPVQPVGPFRLPLARKLHERLQTHGVLTVLQKPRCGHGANVTFIVTANHTYTNVITAGAALAAALEDVEAEEMTTNRQRAPLSPKALR